MNDFAKQIASWRHEREWHIQTARLYRAAGRAKSTRPRLPWLPDFEGVLLKTRARAAVHKARSANRELIALRLLAHESSTTKRKDE